MSTAELYQYFDAERQAGLLAAALGVVSISASYLWFVRSPFKAMVWPLVIVGVLELGVGIGLVMRTSSQVQVLEAGFHTAPQSTAATELHRMARVNQSFRIIKGVEVFLLVTGLFLAFFLHTKSLTWPAVGMGLLLQAAVMLIFDIFAEHRAHVYARWLSAIAGLGGGA